MLKKIWLIAILIIGMSSIAAAGQLSVKVEPQKVQFGDTVQFEIRYEGDDAGSMQPDLSVLGNDFTIYSTSTSMQSNFINGVGRQERVWNLLLMPKHEGKITIPAIALGSYKTAPTEVEVVAAGSMPNGVPNNNSATTNPNNASAQNNPTNAEQNKFWAELTVDNKQPYLQQQINATLVIYDNVGIEFQQEPYFINTDGWEIKKLGDPEVTQKNGQRIIKFKYAMFAQKSGEMTLPSAQIDGFYTEFEQAPATNSLGGFFRFFEINMNSMFGQQRPVKLLTKPLKIAVKSVPQDYGNDWWLPASALNFSAKWVDTQSEFKVGEAATREITLTAAGVSETQLPEPDLKESTAWKQYPERPQFENGISNNELISQAVTRVVYIPQESGEQTIPEIRLRWFNVKTQHIENALIPAQKIYVREAAKTTEMAQTKSDLPSADTPKENINKKFEKTANKFMQYIWILLSFVAGVFLSLLFLQRKNKTNDEKTSLSDNLNNIEKCLNNNDYRGLRDALLQWGEITNPGTNISNLKDLAEIIGNNDFSEQMMRLNANLYAGKQDKIEAKLVINALKSLQNKNKKKREKPLPDLYK